MKQLKVSLPGGLRAQLDAASAKSGRSVAEEIRSRVEASFAQEAVDKSTRDLLEGVALMAAEIERETGAAWDKHAGAHGVLKQAIGARLEKLMPRGSFAFGDRLHATVFEDDPLLLGLLIESRLRRQPDFTTSETRKFMEEEHQRSRADRRMGPPRALLETPQQQRKPGQPKKRGK